MVRFVAELPASFCACELPVDQDAMTVHVFIPCVGFALEMVQGGDSAVSQTLATEQADLDLGLVQPASGQRK